MRESMTLIEQANIFNKTNHQSLYFAQITTKKNINAYTSSRPIISNTTQQTKYYHSDKFILPPIDKDSNRTKKKIKRPIYRTSLYHSNTSSCSHIDLSLLTARGKKPDLTTTPVRDDQTVMNFQRHHAPPPSPSDDHIERILSELNRTRQSTPQTSTEIDGNIPYRLPALHQSAKRRHTDLNFSSKDIKSTLSNYLQTYY